MRNGAISLLAVAMLLTACGETAPPPGPVDVEQMNEDALGPVIPIQPSPITFAMIEKHDLFGAGCNFKPGGGEDIVLIADNSRAHFFLDGELKGATSDSGSEPMPLGAWSDYDGLEYSVDVTLDRTSEKLVASGVVDFEGRLVIRDARDHAAYDETGIWQCGS